MTEPAIRITGRRSSHFTRVAVIFAHEMGLSFELQHVSDLTRLDAASFAGNPALKVPTLHVNDALVFGTENICRRLIELAGRSGDPRFVLAEHTRTDIIRNAQELVWHAMAAQVQLRMGITLCGLPADNPYFEKSAVGLIGALVWLETHLDQVLSLLPSPRDLSLFEVTLFCLIGHIEFRPSVTLDPYPRLKGFAAQFATRDSAQRTPYRLD